MENNEKQLKIDCSKLPSKNNCQLVIMAPERQKDNLVAAGAAHAEQAHEHEDTPELRKDLERAVEPA